MSNNATLEPGDRRNFCEDEWSMSVDIELTCGVGGSWTVLDGMRDTVQEFIVSPSDGTVNGENPSATANGRVPAIPFMSGAQRGDRMTFTLEVMFDDTPVFATS